MQIVRLALLCKLSALQTNLKEAYPQLNLHVEKKKKTLGTFGSKYWKTGNNL